MLSARLPHRYVIVALLGLIAMMLFRTLMSADIKDDTNQMKREAREEDVEDSRVLIWAVPRSMSTTLLNSLSHSPNTQAWFEPFLIAYQSQFLSEEVMSFSQRLQFTMANMFISGDYDMREISYEWVKEQLERRDQDGNIVVKDMVRGISDPGRYEFIPDGYTHTILIRHPLRVFTSYKQKHNTEGGMNEGLILTEYSRYWIPEGYFFKEIYDLAYHLRHVLNQKVVIIDSDDLLDDPESMLKAYCQEIGLTYSDKMLHWKAQDRMWWDWMLPRSTFLKWLWMSIRYGYNTSHKTSFSKSSFDEKMGIPLVEEVDTDVLQLAEASMKYYKELYRHRFNPTVSNQTLHPGDIGQAKQYWHSFFFR